MEICQYANGNMPSLFIVHLQLSPGSPSLQSDSFPSEPPGKPVLYWGVTICIYTSGKKSYCREGDLGLIPGSGSSPGEGKGYLLQYSCPENSIGREGWRATVHGVTKSWTQLNAYNFRYKMFSVLSKKFGRGPMRQRTHQRPLWESVFSPSFHHLPPAQQPKPLNPILHPYGTICNFLYCRPSSLFPPEPPLTLQVTAAQKSS